MQINRLLDIVQLLLKRKQITAKALAEHFGVSMRTIYRDIDALSLAGIPVYTTKGSGGGIQLMREFTIDRSFLSEKEQKDILFALQSLHAAQYPDIEATLSKIGEVFKNASQSNWIEVDFSYWGSSKQEKEKFGLLREAVLSKRVISFEYFNSQGTKSARFVEPLKLLFKGRSWYLYGHCHEKNDYRLFRISRIRSLVLCEAHFSRKMPDFDPDTSPSPPAILLKLKFSQSVAHRVYDDFNEGEIEYIDEQHFTVTIRYPFDEWVIGYLLSFGSAVEVLEPPFLKDMLVERAKGIINLYAQV